METFEFNGDKYEKASRHQKQWGNKLISQLQIKGNERILDLGCGDGVLTEQLAQLVPKGSVLGIDASKGMLQAAKKHVRDNLQFMQLDMNQLNYKNEFDIIFSNAALHWVKDHNRLLHNIFAALKPGGMILWNFAGNGTCSNFIHTIQKKMKEEAYKEYFLEFDWPWYMPIKSEYEKLVESIDFSVVSIEEENADRYFFNTEEMIQWIDQPCIVPFLNCIPEEKKEGYREEVIQEMVQRTLQPDGTCFETFRRIRVCAIKDCNMYERKV